MTDLLLELRSEEIPARMQSKARDDLARLFAAELAAAGLTAGETVTYATPRRLTLIARDLPDQTEAVSAEVKGPKTSAPPQALDGFLRKTGLTREQLTERDGTWFAVTAQPGRATIDVLAAAIPAIIRQFPWPKSMRWGATSASTESPRWVRPLHGIIALFGDLVVNCEAAGVRSGAVTKGHRFHHPGDITIGGAHDYVEKLRACHVIVDQAERARVIATGATMLTAAAGLTLIRDEGLLAENAGLTEWPVPLLGRFDAAFLDVPSEVIQLTARVNQKYFVCLNPPQHGEGDHAQHGGGAGEAQPSPSVSRDAAATSPDRGGLANAFVCVANIDAADGGEKIVEGNRKVLAARLADARFFYETDLKTKLEDQLPKLEKIIFHEKLGTVADKVDRVAKLARWLVEEGIVKSSPFTGRGTGAAGGGGGPQGGALADSPPHHPADGPQFQVDHAPHDQGSSGGRSDLKLRAGGELADQAERAARLCKADLVTGMVGEFPELQGLIGGYYAAAQGEPPAVAAAIRDHYKPVGQGDDVPTDPVTVSVSLADKLDTLVGFFAVGEPPTGSKDPFAIRRAVSSAVRIMFASNLRVSFRKLLKAALDQLSLHAVKASLSPDEYHLADMWYEAQTAGRPYQLNENGVPFRFHENGTNREWFSVELGAVMTWIIDFQNRVQTQTAAIFEFATDRLKVQQREAGVRHDLIDAVFALGGEDDLVRLLARVRALQAFVGTDDGANLLAGYKRAANILKKEGFAGPTSTRHPGLDPGPSFSSADGVGEVGPRLGGRGDENQEAAEISLSYTPEKAETALIAALDAAEPTAARAVAQEDFAAAMTALATLRAPIDAFFDSVIVNDPDPSRRTARLALLARMRDAVHAVADFSKIEG